MRFFHSVLNGYFFVLLQDFNGLWGVAGNRQPRLKRTKCWKNPYVFAVIS